MKSEISGPGLSGSRDHEDTKVIHVHRHVEEFGQRIHT